MQRSLVWGFFGIKGYMLDVPNSSHNWLLPLDPKNGFVLYTL